MCWGLTEVGRASRLFFQSWESVELPVSGEFDITSSNKLYCQCDVHLTRVQTNNLLLRSNLSTWIISSLQNCWGFAKSALRPRNRSPADLHFMFINSCLRPRKTLLMFGRLLSVPIAASGLPTRPMFFDTWISLPVLVATPSWTFRTPISPMPHELPQNLTYSTKLSLTGKRRYRSGNAMRSISISQMMWAPNPFAQKQLQTSNIIQGCWVPMGRVQLLCPISSTISMPTCNMRTSSIHLHPKKIGSLVLGSYGLGWVWQQSIVFSPWSWWAHISIDVLLLIEPSSARLNISCFLFRLPSTQISAAKVLFTASSSLPFCQCLHSSTTSCVCRVSCPTIWSINVSILFWSLWRLLLPSGSWWVIPLATFTIATLLLLHTSPIRQSKAW